MRGVGLSSPSSRTTSLVTVVMIACLVTWSRTASAYTYYSGAAEGGCSGCHASFDADQEELGGISLHKLHRDPEYMGTPCNVCHLSSDYTRVKIKHSDGTSSTEGNGCGGCHPRPGLIGPHGGAGSSCTLGGSTCHSFDGPDNEAYMPSYYGAPGIKLQSPCDRDGPGGEDYNHDGKGLDNDGDGLYDRDDPDCQPCNCAVEPCACADTTTPDGDCMCGDGQHATRCGNGVWDPGENCEPASSCPTACDDSNPLTTDALIGDPANCTAYCRYMWRPCLDDDAYCDPWSCSPEQDNDCPPLDTTTCLDPANMWSRFAGETCGKLDIGDMPACPADCDDGDACTLDVTSGAADTCNISCARYAILDCVNGDDCCPWACTTFNDSDCLPRCGNSVVEEGEICDPPSSCPTTCAATETCTVGVITGNAVTCDAECTQAPVTACVAGDGCCPSGCAAAIDTDCPAVCGDGVVETGETCDPPSSCPTLCDDSDPCTEDRMIGSPATCNAHCEYTAIECPDDNSNNNDNDDRAGTARSLGISCTSCAAAPAMGPLVVSLLFLGSLSGRRRRR